MNELLQAAGRGHFELVVAIMEAGADPNAQNEHGYTALMSAARSQRIEVVDYLLSIGASPHVVSSEEGATALHAAVGGSALLVEEQAGCIRLLLEFGTDANATNDAGSTPLMKGAWFGCTLAVEALLEAGADASLADSRGRTALHLAQARGHESVVALLDPS